MSSERVDVSTSVGYALKEASSALRAAMEEVLRPLGMTVTHYACLELLAQRPDLSNSELARGAFVTRQTMNTLVQSLQGDGSVTRPAAAPVGRVLPARLTARGRERLVEASGAVRAVERRMLSALSDDDQSEARRLLGSMIGALRGEGVDSYPTGRPATQTRSTRRSASSSTASAGAPTARVP